MQSMMTEYETTVVLRPDVGGDAIEATLDKVRGAVANGGKLLAINHWGKKRLAYEIAKQSRGVYVHTQYLGGGDMVAEIERNLRLSESVLRFLTVKVQDAVDPASRESKDYVKPEYSAAMDVEEDDRLDSMPEDDFYESRDDDHGGDDDDVG